MSTTASSPTGLAGARLPRWCLPSGWPQTGGAPALADIDWADGRVTAVRPAETPRFGSPALDGRPVLPGLVDAHTHLDKTFTLGRLGRVEPGLLGAIEAMMDDRSRWTEADVRERASRALAWAHEAGVTRLRSHVDWWEPERTPLAWGVLRELAEEWSDRLAVDRASLMPLPLFKDRDAAMSLARGIARQVPAR